MDAPHAPSAQASATTARDPRSVAAVVAATLLATAVGSVAAVVWWMPRWAAPAIVAVAERVPRLGIVVADRCAARGREAYAVAIEAGSPDAREALYGDAYRELTWAVRIYLRRIDAHPGDAQVEERAVRVNQLRFGCRLQMRPR